MKTQTYLYQAGDLKCQGYYALAKESNSIVLIAPTWEGINHFAKDIAHELACRGYDAFVADLYGEGKVASSKEEAASFMTPLFLDRSLLRMRILSAFHEAKKLKQKIAAIGFCFGGLTVIELLKSGTALSGVVSFHGTLSDTFFGKKAKLAPMAKEIQSSLLLIHGYRDPLVPITDVLKLQQQLDEAKVEWQTIIYGSAAHSFTNPEAKDTENGMYYEPIACSRSKIALYNYLQERFT